MSWLLTPSGKTQSQPHSSESPTITRWLPALGIALAFVAPFLWQAVTASPRQQNIAAPTLSLKPVLDVIPSRGDWHDVPFANGKAQFIVPNDFKTATHAGWCLAITAFGPPNEDITGFVVVEPISAFSRELSPRLPASHHSRDSHFMPRPPIDRSKSVLELQEFQQTLPEIPVQAQDFANPPRQRQRIVALPRSQAGNSSPVQWHPQPCQLLYTGQHCSVWRPKKEPASDSAWERDLASTFDRLVYPRVVAMHGSWPDVDGDAIVNLVVTDQVSEIDDNLKAFVRRQDFQDSTAIASRPPWDVIYIRPGESVSELIPILIHELTHVVEFSHCYAARPSGPWPIPDWLTEGMAHATEMQACDQWQNVDERLKLFALEPHRAPLRVVDAAASGLWRDRHHRGAAAAFCYWWTAETPVPNWPAIIKGFATSDDPWPRLAHRSWRELHREWTISLATEGVPVSASGDKKSIVMPMVSEAVPYPLAIRGSATAFVRLPPHPKEWPQQVTISARAASDLQLTLIYAPLR